MTAHVPSQCFLLVGGKDLSGDTFQLEETVEMVLEQSNGLGDTFEEHLPVGLGRVMLVAGGGFYDDRTRGINEALQGQGATKQIVSYGFAGQIIGAPAVELEGVFACIFKRVATEAELTKANAEYKVTGAYRRSQIVLALTPITTDPTDTRSTPADKNVDTFVPSVLITSSSAATDQLLTPVEHGLITGDVIMIAGHTSTPDINGQRTVTVIDPTHFTVGVDITVNGSGGSFKKLTSTNCTLELQVRDLTLDGFTSVRFTPVHSPDNAVYVALGTAFTDVTAAGTAQFKSVAGAVQRYVAVDIDFIGAGGANKSITAYIAVARV